MIGLAIIIAGSLATSIALNVALGFWFHQASVERDGQIDLATQYRERANLAETQVATLRAALARQKESIDALSSKAVAVAVADPVAGSFERLLQGGAPAVATSGGHAPRPVPDEPTVVVDRSDPDLLRPE